MPLPWWVKCYCGSSCSIRSKCLSSSSPRFSSYTFSLPILTYSTCTCFVDVEGKAPSTPHGDNIFLWTDEEGKVPSTSHGANTCLVAAKSLLVPLWYVKYTGTSTILVSLTSSLVSPWLEGPRFSWRTGEGICWPLNISWAMKISQGMLRRLRWWRTIILIKE